MEAGGQYNIQHYAEKWTEHYGLKTPSAFTARLKSVFDQPRFTYLKDNDKKLQLPFSKPFGFSEKIVFISEEGKIDFEAKITLCASTAVRKMFLREIKELKEKQSDFENKKVYPMHFALKSYSGDGDENHAVKSESMFFYTDVSTWVEISDEMFVDAGNWAINDSGREEAINQEILKRGFGLEGQGDITQKFAENIRRWELGLREKKEWRTEPYSWPSNVLPILDEEEGKFLFVLPDGKPLRFLNYGDNVVEYKNTPKWPYHCIYKTLDGVGDHLLSKYAVIERIVKQDDENDTEYFISHGPVENIEWLLEHRKYLFDLEKEPILGQVLFDFLALQRLDNPNLTKEVNYTTVDQKDVVMEDATNFQPGPLTSEEMDSGDISGSLFDFTHQLYDGLFPYVLDNTKITDPRLDRELNQEQLERFTTEALMLETRMEGVEYDGGNEEESKENQMQKIRKRIEALRNAERKVVRKCTSDHDHGPHYYYNVPLSALGDNLKVQVTAKDVKYWVLGRHTSRVFDMVHAPTSSKVDPNNCAVTRVSTYEEMHELFDAHTTIHNVSGQTTTRTHALDFYFNDFRIDLAKSGACAIPGMGEAGVDRVKYKIDLRIFPHVRIIGPPLMFQAPGMWGFVNSFLRFPAYPSFSSMVIKDAMQEANYSCVLIAFDNMKYIFVPHSDTQGSKFTLREIKPHEQNDFDVLQLIRQSGGFPDIQRPLAGNRFFMRAFTTTHNRTNYEPIANEKLASDRYYSSNDGKHRMPHTFSDGSTKGSQSECIGSFVQIKNATAVPGKDVTSSGMDGTRRPPAVNRRLELIKTPGGGSATHGIDGVWQCWYCGQRRETVANIDVRDGLGYSFAHNFKK